jgi:hypothetical protein
MTDWPVATLDPLQRAKVLAAAIPSAAWAEGEVDAPYESTWAWITDFERSVPLFDPMVHRVRVHRRWREEDSAEQVDMTSSTFGVPARFDVRVEDGFCLMKARTRIYLVVMAAIPLDDGRRTRVLSLEAVPRRGTALLRPALQRAVRADIRGIRRHAPR